VGRPIREEIRARDDKNPLRHGDLAT
jgi:hypothetical protein